MYKKIGVCVLAVILAVGILSGCAKRDNPPTPGPEEMPPVAETPGASEETPVETPEPEPAPTATPEPTPTPTPTPEPKDLPAVLGERLGSAPALILGEDAVSGTVAAGEVFAVALEEDISTGYLWRWEEPVDYDIESRLDTRYEPDAETTDMPAMHLWAFRVSEPGMYTLEFTLVAPDGGAGDVKSFTVTVE